MTQTYIEWIYPGSMVSENSSEKVKSRELPKKFPKMAFGFRFYDRIELETDGEEVVGKPKNYSGWFFLGEELTVADVKEKHPDKTILISNMVINEIPRVVNTKFGQFIPMEKSDKIFTP